MKGITVKQACDVLKVLGWDDKTEMHVGDKPYELGQLPIFFGEEKPKDSDAPVPIDKLASSIVVEVVTEQDGRIILTLVINWVLRSLYKLLPRSLGPTLTLPPQLIVPNPVR